MIPIEKNIMILTMSHLCSAKHTTNSVYISGVHVHRLLEDCLGKVHDADGVQRPLFEAWQWLEFRMMLNDCTGNEFRFQSRDGYDGIMTI